MYVANPISKPHPYDPDDLTYYDGDDDLSSLLPGPSHRSDRIDPLDPMEY